MDGEDGDGGINKQVGYMGGAATGWGRDPARYPRLEFGCVGAPRPNR